MVAIDDFVDLDGEKIVVRRLGKASLAVDALAELLNGGVVAKALISHGKRDRSALVDKLNQKKASRATIKGQLYTF